MKLFFQQKSVGSPIYKTTPTRRQVLKFLPIASLPSALISSIKLSYSESEHLLLISAANDLEDNNFVVAMHSDGTQPWQEKFRQVLPERGHHVAVHVQSRRYVAVARRPGRSLLLGDARSGELLAEAALPMDRHLYGHGVFSSDGRRFYTTESAFTENEKDSGLVGEWLLENDRFIRVGEIRTEGIGPHELLLLPDEQILVVANGGMRTHPASEREVLNPETMQPSLVYIDLEKSVVVEKHSLPANLHQCSIRHLDVSKDGLIAMGLQYQGEPFDEVPLVATHRQGEDIKTIAIPEEIRSQLKQYIGSVRFTQDGKYFAASAPRGNRLCFFAVDEGEFITAISARDVCGLAPIGTGFLFSSGIGQIGAFDPEQGKLVSDTISFPLLWDNHMNVIQVESQWWQA